MGLPIETHGAFHGKRQLAGAVGGDVEAGRSRGLALIFDQRDMVRVDGVGERRRACEVAVDLQLLDDARDLFDTSRRYALALLSHLDERKVTRRVGDERVLV